MKRPKKILMLSVLLTLIVVISAYTLSFQIARHTFNIMPGTDIEDTPLYLHYFSENREVNAFCYYFFYPLCKIYEALNPREKFVIAKEDLDLIRDP
jgi:hypothetical protein